MDKKPPPVTPMGIEPLQSALGELFAPWVRELALQVTATGPGSVTLRLPVTPHHVHGGGVLCGQTLMSAADTAMVLAVMTKLGAFKPMTTVQLQTSFLRAVPGDAGHAVVQARVLKMGRSLAFGAIDIHTPDGQLAAQATTTYALL
ncbi:PaaI family thioesterase [Aquincola tertiaricarbonis]|uniref:PaaI family thioesterase n=1 Tax=Aquincola tertiaricarbonis TaxID=391953 RepID=UPI0035C1E960